MSKPRAIIIGAGYGGMALANILGKAGYRVDVYEKNATAGGRIAAIHKDGYVFDLGPSWYLMPEVFEQYYQLFGESAETRLDLMRFNPGYKVYFEKYPTLTIQGDVNVDKHTFEAIEPGAGRKLERYVAHSSQAYELAVKHFLYNNFLRLRDVFALPVIMNAPRMLALVFTNLDRHVSRVFRDIRLKQLLEYHMVFLGSSPFQAPAIYTLMSHLDYRSGVYYPRRGMLSLVQDMQALGTAYDVEYHYNSPVQQILVEGGKAVGVRLPDGSEVRADIVVSNADMHHTETVLLAPEHQSFPARYWAKRQPGPGALLVSLGVEGTLPDLMHHNLYFVDNWRENFDSIYVDKKVPENASIYVCNPTKTDPSLAPEGHENLFILMPLPAGVALSDDEQSQLADRAIDLFARAIDVPDLAQRITTRHTFGPRDFGDTFNAWQYNAFGGESHLLFQSVIFRTSNQSRKVKNLYYVGAGTVPGIGLPMCLIGAQLTYKKITGNRKAGPLAESDLL